MWTSPGQTVHHQGKMLEARLFTSLINKSAIFETDYREGLQGGQRH